MKARSPRRRTTVLPALGLGLGLLAAGAPYPPPLVAQPPARALELPPRGPGARPGSALLPLLQNLSVTAREQLLWHEFMAGNVPDFLRRFVRIARSRRDALGRTHTIVYDVAPDYLALGGDDDFFRMPLTPTLGQWIADRLDCSLPTRRIVDDVWAAAPIRLVPVPFDPAVYTITSPAVFWQQHLAIERQRTAHPLGSPIGRLVAGTKKDVVVTPRLAGAPGRVAIYGWHRTSGVPIQPLYTGHTASYVDYSHGIRLVRNRVWVDGRATTVAAVLADRVLHPLLGDEGVDPSPRYAVPPPTESVPYVDRFGAAGFGMDSWRPKFTPPRLAPFTPRSPGGDGTVVVVQDPRGGTETLRCGSPTRTDQLAQADLYCEHRPGLAGDGFERIGVFVRDRAQGAFDGTASQDGACYALVWDSHDGRVRCLRVAGGIATDLLPVPVLRPGSRWRRFRIEARGARLKFSLDGHTLLETVDATHPSGESGIGYHEFFRTNSHMRGTRADNWFADVPDALLLAYDVDSSGGGGGNLTIHTTRGVPGNLYFRPVTTAAGAFPNGWFFGLDPTPAALQTQFATAHPAFVGFFDADGRATTTLAAPPGLTLHGVALDLFTAPEAVAVSPPAAYVVR